MVRLTLIARISDSLPLAEGLDSEKDTEIDQYKTQAKSLFKKFSQMPSSQTARMSVDSGNYMFHYILQSGVAFLTLTEKGYPKKLAFQYLEELASEFDRLYGPQVDAAQRPYAFIKFDTFIQKTKKLYMDTRTQRNLLKLNEDLSEVQQIMTKNIADVLAQGTKLEDISSKSHDLSEGAKKYKLKTEQMYRQAILRKYVPLAVVVVVVLLVIWLRAKFYGK